MENKDSVIHELKNGRKYKVIDTGTPYVRGEYPSGGFVIFTDLNGKWAYVANSPDENCVKDFLRLAERLSPRTQDESIKAIENSSAEKHWENFIDLLNKEDPLFFDKEKKEQSPHKSFLGSIEKYKTLFLRANSGE